MTTAGFSQTACSSSTGTPAPARCEPQAIPAKIALVAFEQAVFATNEGQRAVQEIQDKYKPKKDQIDTLSKEVDSLKAQLQSAPATLSDEERATRLRNIDTKEKELNRNAEDAQTAYNADLQEAYGKVAAKVSVTLKDYVSKNGYTLLLDVSGQQSNVMWANQSTDVTQAIVTAYNASSGVAAPPPAGPSSLGRHDSSPASNDDHAEARCTETVIRTQPPKAAEERFIDILSSLLALVFQD